MSELERPAWMKPEKGTAKAERRATKRGRRATETTHKDSVRHRDHKRCRFPLCGCYRRRLRLEVSHDRHKGIGGNPKGDRSLPPGLILMCWHRHQTGAFSRHKMTIRNVYLTDEGNDGPVAWEIKRTEFLDELAIAVYRRNDQKARELIAYLELLHPEDWIELAREESIQRLEPLQSWQREALEFLARMEV